MKITRTVIAHAEDRVELTGLITYVHPVTKQTVTEEYTVTLKESESLPNDGWTNDDAAVAVDVALKARGIVEVVEVAAPVVVEPAPVVLDGVGI